jgi:hypothetical protein
MLVPAALQLIYCCPAAGLLRMNTLANPLLLHAGATGAKNKLTGNAAHRKLIGSALVFHWFLFGLTIPKLVCH